MKKERKNPIQKSPEILVVEDSLTQATQIKHLLESHNYKVTVAQNGKQAMDRLSKHKPSLVISDIVMPEINGYELCKKIKSNKSIEDIPVILLTRLFDSEEIIEGLNCGADSFITKPFNEKYLLSHIEKILSTEIGADHKKVPFSTQIFFKGKKRFIQTEQQNVIRLMLDIYEGAIHQNERLVQTEEELRLLNERLESLVKDRTSDLAAEIKLSNQIAERLKESEERFRNLYNDAVVGLYRTNSNGEILLANRALVEMLGFQSFEELAKRNLRKPGYGPSYQRQVFIDQVEKEGEVKDLEAIWICRDGKEIFVRESAKAICDSEGKILYYDGSVEDITEQKLAETKLQETKEYLTNLFNHANAPIIVWNTSLYITRFNNAFEHLSGYGSEEVIGKKVDVLFPKEKIESSLDLIKRAFSGERWENVEIEILRKDGDSRIVLWNSSNILDKDGKTIVATIAQGNDITERKLVEENLRSSEERLKILFDYAPDGYYLNDLKGNLIDGNIAAEKLMGYSRNELIGKSFLKLKLLSLKQIPKAAKLLVKNSLGQGTGPDEFVLNRKDGSKVTVEIITYPVKIKDKTQVLGLARDITERKRIEEAMHIKDWAIESAINSIVTSDIEGNLNYVNPAFLKLWGYNSPEEVLGKPAVEFWQMGEKAEEVMEAVRTKGGWIGELVAKNKDGDFFDVQVAASIVINDTGQPVCMHASFADITERKLAEKTLKFAKEKAEQSDRLKTSFLNNISHEVRTPLNGILGFAEIMSQPDDLSEEEKKLSHSMLLESSDRLLNTITNYMDISLIASGNMIVNRKDFVPGQIMKELLGKYMTICSGRKLELLLKMPEHSDRLSINSDPEIISKIMSHLLNNAIKYTEKGSIQYGFTIRENELEFFVKDTGIGIGKESFKRIFEHFIKEDRGPLKITEGSGLGLSISTGLVVLLGGKIWVESEKRKGSCFYFTIPVEKKIEDHILIPTAGKQTTNVETNSILVAEDDEVNFFYLKALLKQNTSAEIIHASNGKEAIDKFKENPNIGLVLMDIKMPVMDGLEATRQIKAINRNIPVIAITAYAMPGDENRITEAGCDYYLNKPINKKLLLDKMAELIVL